jgi:hypothetical protein
MNIAFPQNPLYKGLAFIIGGAVLLSYATGMTYTIINLLVNLFFVAVAIGLIYKGCMLAGFDKLIMALYNKIMKKNQ